MVLNGIRIDFNQLLRSDFSRLIYSSQCFDSNLDHLYRKYFDLYRKLVEMDRNRLLIDFYDLLIDFFDLLIDLFDLFNDLFIEIDQI